jgi:uncharacterized protein GlcG (DUF336 family)
LDAEGGASPFDTVVIVVFCPPHAATAATSIANTRSRTFAPVVSRRDWFANVVPMARRVHDHLVMPTATIQSTRELLPSHATLREALIAAQRTNNGGLGFHMWASLVDRNGFVIAVCYSGEKPDDQWPASRIIAATKASTANALSLDRLALSTANLYSAVQPGGPLFGLAEIAPVNIHAAYGGDPQNYGTPDDHMIGLQVGGVSVFGGGLALYDEAGHCVGGLGVSGDLSCADHNIAWKVRHALELDYLPGGVDPLRHGDFSDDNIVYDLDPMTTKSKSGWGHPACAEGTTAVAKSLPVDYPPRKRTR